MKVRRMGTSLVELLIVVGVIGVVAALAAPSFSELLYRKRVEGVTAELVSDLAYLRSQALLKPGPSTLNAALQVGDGSARDCYALFWLRGNSSCSCSLAVGSACSHSWAEIKVVRLPSANNLQITTNHPANRGWFPAATRTFMTPAPGTLPLHITVGAEGAAALRVVVDQVGRIATCSPGGRFPGYASCAD